MSQIDPWTNSATEPSAQRLAVPKSSFNFAASEWNARRRERRFALVATSLVTVLLLTAVTSGVRSNKDATAAKNAVGPLKTEQLRLNEELRTLTGGIDDLPGVVAQQQGAIEFVFSRDFDERAVLQLLQRASVQGVTIDTVSVVDRETTPGEATAKLTSAFVIQITATGAALDSPAKWQEAMSALSDTLLEAPEVSYSVASGTAVTMTLQAGLRDPAVMTRRANARALVGDPKAGTP